MGALLDVQPAEDNLPTNESELSKAANRLEATVSQLSRELFESRESEARLSERASIIADQMTSAAETIDEASSLAVDANTIREQNTGLQGSALMNRTRNFLLRVQSHIGLEVIKLLQMELATLAPRQTLASLTSRLLQIRLENTIDTLNGHWRLLSDFRITAAEQEIDRLTDESTGRNRGDSDVMELVRARLALLQQELPILQKKADASQSILNE